MNNKIVMISIAAVIGIIVLGSVLMPILDDATATTDTFTNEGMFKMSEISATDSETYTLSYTVATNTLTINGETADISGISSAASIVAGDTFFLRLQPNARAYLMGSTSSSSANYFGYNADSLSVSMTSGTLTATATTSGTDATATFTYTKAYIIDESGDLDYIMKTSNSEVYVLADSPLFASGQTSINASDTNVASAIIMEGTIEDGVTFTAIKGATTATFDDIVIDAVADSDHENLYKLSKVTAVATYDGEDTDITYSYFVVPSEVTAERDVHFTDGQNAILGAIPIMILVAILLGVVALVIRSRMD